jgi:ABC-2 type transport system ATP-binding protein
MSTATSVAGTPGAGSCNAIEANDLTKVYGRPDAGAPAVDHVSFVVRQGEVFGFLGPNGAGKTTTVRMLTGVIDPTAGTATIQGHDIRRESLAARAHLGIIPEEANVYLDLSVWQNVMLMAELHAVPRRRRVREGERLLDLMGLADRRKQKAHALSKGLRQRLMLCSALVSGPEILFLDEPTTGLDVHSTRLIRDLVRDLNRQGLTVFLTTHNMEEAEDLCHWVAIIDQGRIIAIDTPDRLRELVQASQYVEVRFEGSTPADTALESLPGVERVTRRNSTYRLHTTSPGRVAVALAAVADRNGWVVDDLCTRKPSLGDVFLYLTGGSDGEARR